MVVLSAAIITSGKTLIARQFVEMTRLRVEGLMSAFSKLVDSGRDHTFIETESVRYIYQPMEALHLVLVTNKASNILEDLETLRLLAKVVQDCCQIQVNEELVLKHAFDIVFAFDEVISFGHRESVTLSQIKTYTEMDSHEEKLHQMIEQSKINEARETMKKKQMEIAKQKASQPKETAPTGISSSDTATSFGSMNFKDSSSISSSNEISAPSPPWSASMADDSGPATLKPGAPKRGMALTKKRPGDMLAGMGIAEPAPAEEAGEKPVEAAPAPVVNPLLDPVKVDIEEKITADLQADGGLKNEAVCGGQFQVTVLDAAKGDLVCFKLSSQSQDFKYKVHPSLNKASHSNNVLEVRDPEKPYRVNTPALLLKWQYKTGDEDFLPITLTCWPTSTSDGTQMTLELDLTDDGVVLEEVSICLPASQNSRPSIASVETGEANYNAAAQQVQWLIPLLDKDTNKGLLEFSACADAASLLPAKFMAVRRGATRCPMDILECYHQARKDPISYALEKSCVYDLTIG
mmetsp:Transcript_19151/g.43554  ORF Transcript_19151/g.43554 Transcript_19151/m.43554 type:complete len:520 (-) Transcript_19151:91-1650(-)